MADHDAILEDTEWPEDDDSPPPQKADPDARLTMVVDDLHVVYRVWTPATEEERQQKGLRAKLRRGRPIPIKREIHALRGVSFVARHGEAIGVIGKNGAGKSTLMRGIAGLLPANAGKVYASAQPTMLGVSSALMPALPGRRNVELGLLALGLTPDEVRERAPEIIEFAAIGSAIDMPMRTYSSGMGARLKFAIASAVSHDILLIDEALATGDGEFLKRSAERIRQLRADAETIFLVSHSMGAIRSTCARVIWLDEGRILADGDADDIVPEYEARFGLKTGKALRERRRKRKEANEKAKRQLKKRQRRRKKQAKKAAEAAAAATGTVGAAGTAGAAAVLVEPASEAPPDALTDPVPVTSPESTPVASSDPTPDQGQGPL